MPEIHDIIETSEVAPLLLWWQWALLVFAAVIILAAIVAFLRRTKAHASKQRSDLDIALNQLSNLDTSNTTSNRLAVHLSLIVRQYLQRHFQDSALFETDEEFHARSAQLENLPPQAATHLSEYLTSISEHKYAPNLNHPAALESLIDKASTLLRALDTSATSHPSQ